MHTIKEVDMLTAKIDLLLKRLREWAQEKEAMIGTIQAMDSHMMCEVYGNVGHSGNDCPKTCEEVAFINNGFRQPGNNEWNNQSRPQGNSNYNSNYNSNQPFFKELVLGQASGNDCPKTCEEVAFINNGFRQPGNNGWNNQSRPQGNSNYNSNYNWNQPFLKELLLGQTKINENITKKLMHNDKMLKNINSQIKGLTSVVKNQLSFNKMVEIQLAQIATAIPIASNGKIPAQPKNSHENVKVVTTRGGKTTRDPPNPN
jgi:hypothetical protein